MNELLLKILDRYEMDKPILMADKLDIIWDKDERKFDGSKLSSPGCKDEKGVDDAEHRFNKDLADFKLTAEEAKAKKEAQAKARTARIVEMRKMHDNVNQYVVKKKLDQCKVNRANKNAH